MSRSRPLKEWQHADAEAYLCEKVDRILDDVALCIQIGKYIDRGIGDEKISE